VGNSANVAIGRLGVNYFYNRGYRTIAFLGPSTLGFSALREAGYRERMSELELPPHCFEGNEWTPDRIAHLLRLDARTAVVCAADNFARSLIESLDTPLVTVPSRLAVLGVDDDSLQNALSSLLNELTDARINKARELLTSTTLHMKEISSLLGMEDQSRFSMTYKRETGESPTQYRHRVLPIP
jgi:DNA-binding LacI/PurR family transcriptional regulator